MSLLEHDIHPYVTTIHLNHESKSGSKTVSHELIRFNNNGQKPQNPRLACPQKRLRVEMKKRFARFKSSRPDQGYERKNGTDNCK